MMAARTGRKCLTIHQMARLSVYVWSRLLFPVVQVIILCQLLIVSIVTVSETGMIDEGLVRVHLREEFFPLNNMCEYLW